MGNQETIQAYLFDVYPSRSGVTIWLIDRDGRTHCCFRNYTPSFFLHLTDTETKRALFLGTRCSVPVSFERTTRTEIYSGEPWSVLQVNVHDPTRFKEVVWYYERFFPHFAFFDSDILVPQLFLYETGLFPLAFCDFVIDGEGQLLSWEFRGAREEKEYSLPPLSMMWLRNANSFVPPKYRNHLQLEVSYEERTYTLEQHSPREVLETLNWHLHRCDPDILLTEYGDSVLLPQITQLAQQHDVPLLLNRDSHAGYTTTRSSSFFQYGKIVHKDGAFELAGRWHLDEKNSFTIHEADLDGVFELARLTQIPVQRQARASIGTSMSSMQLSWAHHHGILIPAKKREPEDFKPASTLLLADRGGLIFNPPVGYHEEVAELDFVSMHPKIMVEHNISPETINCRCCHNEAVPELRYTICEKRRGIVPNTLEVVVNRRSYYKKKKKEFKGKDTALFQKYDRRQNALKWMLVSCFGYLGYKNARFGRIEAHEAVNAFSRNTILTAKEIAEAKGFRLLHGIIDCLWLKKEGAHETDYEQLCRDIGQATGIEISLEGIYNWIVFPASKTDPLISTANHYTGWYRHGELKVRGLETRRHDTPLFIKNMQKAMIGRLEFARNVAEVETLVPELLDVVRNAVALLRSGKANPMELVLRRNIMREPDEYTNNSISAVVSKMISGMGITLAAGESIEFIILDQSGKKKPEKAKPLALYAFEDGYDIDQYTEFALKAAETLLFPFGYDVQALKTLLGLEGPRRKQGSGAFRSIPLYRSVPREQIPLFEHEMELQKNS